MEPNYELSLPVTIFEVLVYFRMHPETWLLFLLEISCQSHVLLALAEVHSCISNAMGDERHSTLVCPHIMALG